MKHIDVTLRNTETGEIRTYHDDHPWDITDDCDDGILYAFSDGNYSCDCNRSGFMYGLDYDNLWDCSDGRIAVDKIAVRETGEVIAESL